jgi:hypothetical protein
MRSSVWTGLAVIAGLFLIAACGRGGGDDGSGSSCPQNGIVSVLTTSRNPLLSVTVAITQSAATDTYPLLVNYSHPDTAAVLAGYPPGSPAPGSFGIGMLQTGPSTTNPLSFDMTFDRSIAKGSYGVVWRFLAVDAQAAPLGCKDLPVTYTVQ